MEKIIRYKLKIVDSVTPIHGFVKELNNYFKDTPWDGLFLFGTDGKCFYDKTETYSRDFDVEHNTDINEQIAEVAKKYFGEKFDYIEAEDITKFCVVLDDAKTVKDSHINKKDVEDAIRFFEGEYDIIEEKENFEESDALDAEAHIFDQIKIRGWNTEFSKMVEEYFMRTEDLPLLEGIKKTIEYLESLNNKTFKDSEDQYEADKYKGKEWGVFAKRSRAWVAFGTEKAMKEKAKNLNELNKKDTKVKDGAINYKHSKHDMPSYGVDLRNLEQGDEEYNAIYFHDMFEQTEDLIEDANEKIQAKGYELVDDYYGDEVKLTVDPGYYEGFTLNIEADEDTNKELLDYAFGLMKEIAKEVGLVKMKFGGWTGPVYLNDSEYREINAEPDELVQIIKGFKIGTKFDLIFDFGDVAHCVKEDRKTVLVTEDNYSDEKNWRLELTTGEYGFSEDNGFSGNKEITLVIKDKKPVKHKDSKKKLKDMNAEEIINLINEAGAKGRSWGWLEGKLPSEFLNMYGGRNRNEVFPVKHTRNYTEGVHLTKPKSLGANLDFSWVPEYKELKAQLDDLYDTYGATDTYSFGKKVNEVIQNEDSISKRTAIEEEQNKFNSLVKAITHLVEASDLIQIDDYRYYHFYEKDFNFNEKEYMKDLLKSRQNKQFEARQKRTVITTPEKGAITNNEDKVEPLSTEAEAYIRRILKEEDTENIKEKRVKRFNNSWNSTKDILDIWRDERLKLKDLLRELRDLEKRGTIQGLTYNPPGEEVVYSKGGSYNYSGNYVGQGRGNYKLTGNKTKPKVSVRGVAKEEGNKLAEAVAKAFSSRTVKDLKQALEDALDAVKFLPNDSDKIDKAKQDIVDFINNAKLRMNERNQKRVKRLPDNKFGSNNMLYLFPDEDFTKEDLAELKEYDLELLGTNTFKNEKNYVVRGTKRNLRLFAEEYLGYQLHPNYLYEEDEFAGNIKEI